MTRPLPSRPSLDHLKHQARSLQRAHAAGDPEAKQRVEAHLPGHAGKLTLAKAQTVIAREHGIDSWPRLKAEVERQLLTLHHADQSREAGLPEGALQQLLDAIDACDLEATRAALDAHPALLALQVGPAAGTVAQHACRVDPLQVGRSPTEWIALLSLLLERGAEPRGCLFALAYGEREEAIRLLHRYGADLEEVVHDETPLLHALKNRMLDSAASLLELGADPHHADSRGATALHFAVRQYHEPEVIDLLLDHGAPLEARTAAGNRALDLAVAMGRRDAVEHLTSRGAAPGAVVVPPEPSSDDIRLRPLLAVVQDMDAVVAFYEGLGFECLSRMHDHAFAVLSLGGAVIMIDGGAEQTLPAQEGVCLRCSPPGFEASARAAAQDATDAFELTDPSGFTLRFEREDDRESTAIEPVLRTARPRHDAAFYGAVGFARVPGPEGLASYASRSATVHLREAEAVAPRITLWLTCDDFDGTYRALSSKLEVPPPEVAFHGDILFELRDPEGHRLVFNAPATDL